MNKPIVAIVGRQNVGKSTLLNRLAGKRTAIVADMPGTTRDRVFTDITWQDASFTLVDTGGLEVRPSSAIAQRVKEQVKVAVAEADVIIFLVDSEAGVVPADLEIAQILRRSDKPVILAVNKSDNPKRESEAVEFYEMGLGEPLAISAYHGRGTAELLDRVGVLLPIPQKPETGAEIMKLAIVGRPNVGKSTLLNSLLGEERAIVDKTPGTTHDATNSLLDFRGQNVIVIDTAGIRRRGRWGKGVERYSVIRALRAIDEADIVLLVLDATELLTSQDEHIAGYIQQAARGVIIVVNKWDLAVNQDMVEANRYIRKKLKFMSYAPVVYTSARLGQGVDRIMPQAFEVYQERQRRMPTTEVNSVVQQAVKAHNLPRKGKKQLKILYATQAEIAPPTFVFFVNDPSLVHFSYQHYLENRLRQSFGFTGTPLRFIFKTRGEQ